MIMRFARGKAKFGHVFQTPGEQVTRILTRVFTRKYIVIYLTMTFKGIALFQINILTHDISTGSIASLRRLVIALLIKLLELWCNMSATEHIASLSVTELVK